MTEQPECLTRDGPPEWEKVASHDFEGPDELDATILAALDDESLEGRPLYTDVDTEPAERFLSTVSGDDASVVFSISDRTVRVSSDGTIEVRTGRLGGAGT